MGVRRLVLLGSAAKTAMPVVLVAPFLPWWAWPAVWILLGWTCSRLALLAVGAGLVTLHPAWGWWVAGVCLVATGLWIWNPWIGGQRLTWWTPHSGCLDSFRGRWIGIQLACLGLTWWGKGPGSMRRDLQRWTSRGVRSLPLDSLFCDPLQVVYEYGVLGGCFLASIVGWWALTVDWSTPWAAAGVSYAVLSTGHSPTRVALGWARRRFRQLVPEPPLLADLTVHVVADGTFRLYTDRDRAVTPEGAAVVAAAVLRAGKWLADQHGLTIEQIGLEA